MRERLVVLAFFYVYSVSFVAMAQSDPDVILHNGRFYTVDAERPMTQAVAIRGGRIAAVGTNEEMFELAGPATRMVNLEGHTVTPGWIDSHGHLMNLGISLQNLDFVGTTSLDEIVQMVAVRAESTAWGQWILGRGWDQNDWEEKAFPDHEALSAATPHHPVYLTRVDGHAGFANARAMAIAGITADTPDPPGGKILRDPVTDEPTGVFIDAAQRLVRQHIPAMSTAQRTWAIQLAINECLRYGVTSVHDAGVPGQTLDLYEQLIDRGPFDLRVYAMISAGDNDALDQYFTEGPLIGFGDERLTVRSIKIMADGALGSRGAALLEEYSDDPGNTGLMVTPPERIRSLVNRALDAGFQVCTHAIGDRANRIVLDAYGSALLKHPRVNDPRLRIEHAQVIALEDIPRFARLDVIASMQATHATSDMYWAEDRLGEERVKGAYTWRKLLDEGVRIANGSDFPVEGVNPLWGFYAAITRQDHAGWPEDGWMPGEKMTRKEALRSFTLDAAYAAFEEDIKGSIEPGKLADFAVFSGDIMWMPPKDLLETRVVMTILGGKIVYRDR